MKINKFQMGAFRKEAGEGGEGGGQMSEGDFQKKVLGTLDDAKDEHQKTVGKIDDMVKNFDQLDKDTKKAFDELTTLKNHSKGLDSDVAEIGLAIKKVNLALANEQRGSFGSLGRKVASDTDKAKGLIRAIGNIVGMDAEVTKALGEDSSPGSTMIDDELSMDIYDALSRFGKWSTLGVKPMGTKQTKIPVKTARPVANFILTEAGTIADDTTKAGTTKTLEAEVIAVLLNVSKQLLADADVDVVADILDDFVEAFNYRMDFAMFQGAGTANATMGGVTGVFNFGTGATAAATRTTVAATKYTDWLKCLTTVDDVVLERAARWWMHPKIMAAAIGVQDSNGRPIFQTAQEAPASGVGSIFGYPVTLVSAAPSTDDADNQIAAFGDPRAFAVGVRKDFEIEASDHARWNTYERSFRGVGRADGVGLVATALAVLSTPAA